MLIAFPEPELSLTMSVRVAQVALKFRVDSSSVRLSRAAELPLKFATVPATNVA
jgi:hypothetical protein